MSTPPPTGQRLPRHRVAVGPKRPQYLQAAENDRMMMIVTALASEFSAMRDRLDTHEALAEKGVPATAAAIEAHVPSAECEARREMSRLAMLRRVYRVVTEELDSVRQRPDGVGAATAQMPEGWDKT